MRASRARPDARLRASRRAGLFVAILAIQFVAFEVALRTWGSSEAAPAFQGLFETDAEIGYRLKPRARTHFRTSEFAADIAINAEGLRDDEDVGPKAAGERRILLLGDSIVLSVQVPLESTFGEILERRLNDRSRRVRYRVLNAGVQGYGPVEEMLLFRTLAARLQPDIVLMFLFVGNDAEEALQSASKLDPARPAASLAVRESLSASARRLVRRSMVLQVLRRRVVAATDRLAVAAAPPEPPFQIYAARPAARIPRGLAVMRRAVEETAALAAARGARLAVVLVPARFQVDDADYGRLREAVMQAGGELVRDAATERFADALATVPVPLLDVLPPLRRALPGPDVFYQTTTHLTPRGHEVVAQALEGFLVQQDLLEPAQPRR